LLRPNKTNWSGKMGADPAFFASQVIFFVWAAVLTGFFVKCLMDEVSLEAWRTSRTVWSCCLCVSSTIFVIDQLDPRAILGLYPSQLVKFIEWAEIVAAMQSVAFAGYVYMTAMYRRNMGSVPAFLRNFWLGFNLVFSLTHLVLGAIGAATDNVLWFGISEALLVVQEVAIVAVLNVSIAKLSRYLRQLTQEVTSVGGTATNYGTALRKMSFVGVITVGIAIIACIFEIAAPGHIVDNLSHPGAPIFYINSQVSAQTLVFPALICVLHSLLLYMIRRPRSKSETTTKESSSAARQPSGSVWRPSVAGKSLVTVDVAGANSLPSACDSPSDTRDSQPGACDIVIVP